MPYSSDAQRRWAHTDKGEKALGGPKAVNEWDQASKGKNLPEHVKKMAEGGVVSYTPPPPPGQMPPEGDEFTEGLKSGMNHDLDAVKAFLISKFGKGTPEFGSTLGT